MTTVAALATALLAPATVADAATLAPDGAAIEGITVSGTGCTSETTVYEWDDATEFRVRYGNLSARAGGTATPPDTRRACTLLLKLAIPEGYTVALNGVKAHRYVDLADGARATAGTKAYWQGKREEIKWTDTRRGPAQDYWYSEHTADPSRLVYAPCDEKRGLNITADIAVLRGTSDPAAESTAGYDTFGAGPNAIYSLTWKRCGA
jgi:hypothetical protein